MAGKRSTVELIFQGVDRTGEATQAALRNAEKFTGSLQNATAPIADFTKSAVKLEAGLLAAGAAITTFAIVAAGDFDSAFREISTLIDRPIEDLQDFREAILDYSKTSTQPLEQITQAIYSAISAGADYADAIAAVAQAEQLAIAGKAGLNDSLVVLVSSLNAYGYEMDQAERFSDALFTTVKLGQTTLPELAGSLASVTGLAATAGVDFEELLAAIAALTATGTPTSQAITQIQGAISAILKPAKQAQDLAHELGIEFNLAALESKGFAGFLDDVQKATGGNAEQMALLFGRVEALNGVLTLTGLGADKFQQNLAELRDATGATSAAFEKMSGDISQVNQGIANALRGTLIEIGTPLLQEYSGVAAAIAAVFRAIGTDVKEGQLGGLVEFIRVQMGMAEEALRGVATNLPRALEIADISGITRGIEAVRDSILGLFGVIDISTPEGLAEVITTLAQAFNGLSQFSAGVVSSFGPMFTLLVNIGSGAAEVDGEIFRLLGTIGGIATQIDMLIPLVNTLLAVLIIKEGGGLAKAFAKTAGSITTLLPLLGKAGLVGAAGAAGYAFGTVLNEGINKIVQKFSGSSSLGALIYDLTHDTQDLTFEVKSLNREMVATDSAADLSADALTANAIAASRLNNEYNGGSERLREYAATMGLVKDEATGGWVSIEEHTRRVAVATSDAEDAARGYKVEIIDGVRTYTQVGTAAEKGMKQAADATKDATKASEALMMKMEELASNERIKAMEFKVQLDIAQFEAETKRVEAAFDSINTTINSTGDLLGSLFGDLGDADRLTQLSIERQIEKENKRRDEALKLQKDLTEAQIKALNARTRAMQRGDSLIKIDGAGLQPHLEGFMWEILRTIQVRVNEDGLDMLLGVGS